MHESLLADCTLCPRNCHVDRVHGQRGYCGQTAELTVARAALHQWEEPCISGERGSGTVFFSGCALGCVYCQNHLVAKGQIGQQITVAGLVEIFLDLQGQSAHNINLVTPSHFVPQIIEAIQVARGNGLLLPIVYNCGGYEKVETLQLLAGYVDIYLPDFKYMSQQIAKRYSDCADYSQYARAAVLEMVRQVGGPVFAADGMITKGVVVRHLALPGYLQDSKDIVRHLYQTFRDSIFISIMNQFTPVANLQGFPELNRTISAAEYDELVEYAIALGVENGFIQEGETALVSFIPDFNEEVARPK